MDQSPSFSPRPYSPEARSQELYPTGSVALRLLAGLGPQRLPWAPGRRERRHQVGHSPCSLFRGMPQPPGQLLPAAAAAPLFLASCGPAVSPLDYALGVPPSYLLPEKSLSTPKPALRLCHYFPANTFLCRRACTSGESGREPPGSVS